MSSAFVHAPTFETAGHTVESWLRLYWDSAVFKGDDLIAIHDGSRYHTKECAVVYRNFRSVTGTPGAYFADPVAVVQYRSAMLTAIDGPAKFAHPVVLQDDVLIPLGVPDWSNNSTRVVLQQSARQWVSGAKNTANMADEHVISLFYGALQQLVFAAGNATRASDQRRWFPALVALTRAFSAVHAAYEDARKVSTALVITPGANDMLQKALAYVFYPTAEWKTADRLSMLAIAIKRGARYGTTVAGIAPGPFVLFTLVPLLRRVAHTTGDVLGDSDALLAEFNATAEALLEAYTADAEAADAEVTGTWTPVSSRRTARSEAFQVRVLVSLTRAMGTPLTADQVRDLLAFCATSGPSDEPDWVRMGLLPAPPKLKASVASGRLDVGGRRATSYAARVDVTSETACTVRSYKGVEWAGVQFFTPGTYTVTAHDLGIATRATGDSRGRELTANWRVTVGDDILPHGRAGYSLAGECHERTGHGAWRYRPVSPLSLESPFTLTVTPMEFTLAQNGRAFFRMAKAGRDPVLLGFKNVWLSVDYTAPAPPPSRPTPLTPATAGPRTWASIAAEPVLPTAGLARLRALAGEC